MPAPPLRPGRPMDGLTRRTFLKASGVAGAAALLAGAARVSYDQLAERARTDPLADGTPILVLLTLYGGNDWLNTVVPYADPAYQSARPGLAYDAQQVHRLDEDWGLNPGLPGLAGEWHAGRLAIVRGVGYPKPDRSHFRSMDIWQTASPDRPVTSGWLGRWLDGAGGDPLLALNVGSTLPPLVVGERACASALSLDDRPAGTGDLAALSASDPTDSPAARLVASSYAACGAVDAALGQQSPGRGAAMPGAAAASGRSPTDLDAQLALVARSIKAGVPTRAYTVSLAGFDTHADEREAQQGLLTRLDTALTGFRSALAGHPREADVVVVAYSEFGRRVRANASEGTDHGTAGNVLLLGPGVRGGFVGEPPSLTDLVDDDLATTTDFRDVFAAVAEHVLRTDPQPILGTGRVGLPLFA